MNDKILNGLHFQWDGEYVVEQQVWTAALGRCERVLLSSPVALNIIKTAVGLRFNTICVGAQWVDLPYNCLQIEEASFSCSLSSQFGSVVSACLILLAEVGLNVSLKENCRGWQGGLAYLHQHLGVTCHNPCVSSLKTRGLFKKTWWDNEDTMAEQASFNCALEKWGLNLDQGMQLRAKLKIDDLRESIDLLNMEHKDLFKHLIDAHGFEEVMLDNSVPNVTYRMASSALSIKIKEHETEINGLEEWAALDLNAGSE